MFFFYTWRWKEEEGEREKKEEKRTLQLACRRQPEEGRRPRELTAPTEPNDSADWSAKFREEKKERRKQTDETKKTGGKRTRKEEKVTGCDNGNVERDAA